MKCFVKGVGFLTEIGWLERLERLETRNILKWNATHILSIDILYKDKVKDRLEEYSVAGKFVGTEKPFYEEYKDSKKWGKRAHSSL